MKMGMKEEEREEGRDWDGRDSIPHGESISFWTVDVIHLISRYLLFNVAFFCVFCNNQVQGQRNKAHETKEIKEYWKTESRQDKDLSIMRPKN